MFRTSNIVIRKQLIIILFVHSQMIQERQCVKLFSVSGAELLR